MKLRIIGLIFSFTFVSLFAYSQKKNETLEKKDSTIVNTAKIEKFDPTRNAEIDLQNAIKLATKSKKRIYVDVGGEWCPWCKKLDKLLETNTELNNILNKNYVILKINYSKENKNEKVLSKFPKIKGYPHIFVLDEKGKLLHSQDTGDLESGDHHDPDKVKEFLLKFAMNK